MTFSPKDGVLIIPKIDTGEVHSCDPMVSSRYNVTSDRNKVTASHFQGDLKKIPFDNIFVNTQAFSYKATARISDGKRELEVRDFVYRYDGVSHRGGRIR